MKIGIIASALLAGAALSACVTQGRFDYGNYDQSLYVYSKQPDQVAMFERSLEQSIARGRASGHLAPGLQAELGYCYLKEGKHDAAIAQFKAEMADFPESSVFMTKIISQGGN